MSAQAMSAHFPKEAGEDVKVILDGSGSSECDTTRICTWDLGTIFYQDNCRERCARIYHILSANLCEYFAGGR